MLTRTMHGIVWLANLLLDFIARVLTVIGLIGIATLVSGLLWGTSVIMFATGSMSPAIPTGAAALSIRTAASDIHIGDVVTVPLEHSSMPVSHRVVEVHEVPGQPNSRALTLKGDANREPDQTPCIVASAPRVLFVVPSGGYVLQFLSDIRVTIAIGFILLVLLVRAFGGERIRRALEPARIDVGGTGDNTDTDVEDAAVPVAP